MQTSLPLEPVHAANVSRRGWSIAGTAIHGLRMAAGEVSRIVRRIELQQQIRRENAALLEMPDYLLGDMGLTREQVAKAARERRPLRRIGA